MASNRGDDVSQVRRDGLLAALESAALGLGDPLVRAALAGASPAELRRFSDGLFGLLSQLDDSVSNPGLDALTSRGDGPIAVACARMAAAYGARRAAFSAGGSSAGNIGLGAALAPGGVLLDRGAHLSLYGAVGLARLGVGYLRRDYDRAAGVQLPVTAGEVERGLARHPGLRNVWLTSPTYDGFCADLVAIRAICDRYGARLVVDAAHAAVHGLVDSPEFPPSAIGQGADAAVISLHKKGFGLSQASVVLFNDEALADRYEHFAHLGLQTTSPFHLLVGLADDRVAWGRTPSAAHAWSKAAAAGAHFRAAVAQLPGCRPLVAGDLRQGMAGDPTHAVVNVRATGLTGYDILARLAVEGIDIEMATLETITVFFGPENADQLDDLLRALRRALAGEGGAVRPALPDPPEFAAAPVMAPGDAMLGPIEEVDAVAAIGRVSAQVVGAYPPGQAIIAPGEIITGDAIDYLRAVVAAGGTLKGEIDRELTRLIVVA